MADRSQNRRQASAPTASSGGQGEADIPMTDEVDTTLTLHSQTAQPPRVQRRVRPSVMVLEEEDDAVPMNVESDSDSGSTEDDDYEDYGSDEEDDDDYEDSGSEDDVAADDVAEEQHVPDPTPAVQTTPDAGLSSPTAAVNNASGGNTVYMITDPDLLDCPICLDPLHAPIYQCENGHIACSSCSVNSKNKCPSCCLPIGFNRCRVMEKLVESVTVDCENKESGCTERLIYYKKSEHEKTCPYTLCFCPLSSCGFASSSKNLYDHFKTCHPTSATPFTFNSNFIVAVRRRHKYMILQEQNEGVIFIVNHENQEEHGRILNVDCIGPNSFKGGFECVLSVGCSDICFSVESAPEVCAKWEPHPPGRNRLTIPSDFSRFIIDVCIKKTRT